VNEKIRAGSRFKRVLCFVLIEIRYSLIPSEMSSPAPGVRVPKVEDHWSRPTIESSFLANRQGGFFPRE
jgi:hypothetical protein